jgi:hypothetical protein
MVGSWPERRRSLSQQIQPEEVRKSDRELEKKRFGAGDTKRIVTYTDCRFYGSLNDGAIADENLLRVSVHWLTHDTTQNECTSLSER